MFLYKETQGTEVNGATTITELQNYRISCMSDVATLALLVLKMNSE